MIKTVKWSDGYKRTHGTNVSISTTPHGKGNFSIRIKKNSGIDLDGKMARQVYQVLKKHYETK